MIRYYAPNGRALGWYLGSIVRFEVNKKKNSDFFVTDVSFLIEYRGSNQEPLSVQKGYVSVKGTPVDSETATLDVSALSSHPFAVLRTLCDQSIASLLCGCRRA